MKRINMIAEQSTYNEQGIDIQYLEAGGKRTITVTAKDSVLVNVTLASVVYRNVRMYAGDILTAHTHYEGEDNVTHSCLRNEFGTNISTKIGPSNISGENTWVIPRAGVEYDFYRREDNYVVESWLSNRGGGENLEYQLTTFPNDGFLNGRIPDTLSIDRNKFRNSSILKAIGVLVSELNNKQLNLIISKSPNGDLIIFEVMYYKDEDSYDTEVESIEVAFSVFGGMVASVYKSDDDLDITKIIQAFERVDIVSLDFKMSFNSEVNSLLEIN